MRIPALIAVAVLAASGVASAASPAPKPAPMKATAAPAGPKRVNVEQLQPKSLFPKVKLHVEYVVEVNKMGQVARVRSVKPSKYPAFDAQTYGNALQAFIRTPDDHVILGSYRLSYDYDPKTQRVHRDVALVHEGGVDPNAKGAATDMMEIARHNAKRTPPPGLYGTPPPSGAPNPAPSVRRLPDLPQVMTSPSH